MIDKRISFRGGGMDASQSEFGRSDKGENNREK